MGRAITKTSMLAIAIPTGKRDAFLWCGELKGFGVRRQLTGRIAFVLQYRNRRRVTRRITLGTFPALTLEQARVAAKQMLAKVWAGEDPAQKKIDEHNFQTVGAFADIYIQKSMDGRILRRGKAKKPATFKGDASRVRSHIKPLLGNMSLDDVRPHDVEKMYKDVLQGKTSVDQRTAKGRRIVSGGATAAKKSVLTLSAIFRHARKMGITTNNPCQGIDLPSDKKRERALTADEYWRFGSALLSKTSNNISDTHRDAFWLIAMIGCRRSEALLLQKRDVYLNKLSLRDTKTGPQDRVIGDIPYRLIQTRMKTAPSDLIFASPFNGRAISAMEPQCRAFCEMADLEDVTCHTFRHSFATVADELNYSELTIAMLLGHAKKTQTQNYIHATDPVLLRAANHISRVIAERMGYPGLKANVPTAPAITG